MSKKYDVTIVETLIHTFTVEIESDETPAKAAEMEFTHVNKFEELENYSCVVAAREVENATPR